MIGLRGTTVAFMAGAGAFALGVVLPKLVGLVDRSRSGSAPTSTLPLDASVDVVIPAYLESSVIGDTISHLHVTTATHPGPVRIVVAASDSETAEAAHRAGADMVLEVPRNGKASAINFAAERSTADVIVLTDANCRIQPNDWLGKCIESLAEYSAVSANKREVGGRESLFWVLEGWLKRQGDGSRGSLSMAGELVCLRRADFSPIDPKVILDDYRLARDLLRVGKTATVNPEVSTEELEVSTAEQWDRRVRIARGVLGEVLPDALWLTRTPEGRFQLAHKVYRMTLGCAGFWVAVGAAGLLFPPASLLVLPGVTVAVLRYSGRLGKSARLSPLTALIGMQAVPIGGLLALVRSRRRPAPGYGWAKVKR